MHIKLKLLVCMSMYFFWSCLLGDLVSKGQLILKGLFGFGTLDSSKNQTKKYDLATYSDTSGQLFLEHQKDILKLTDI